MREALHRIWSLVIKELLQLRRDKLLMAFVLLGPLLELTLMGNLVGKGTENLPLAAVDLDRSQASRELIATLDRTDELLLRSYGDSVEQAREQMNRGEIAVIVVVPPGYAASLVNPQQGAQVQVVADDSNYVVSAVAASTAENVAAEIVRGLAARHATASEGPIAVRFVACFNAALDDRPHAITAMLGLIVYQVTLIIAAQSIIRERELGTLEQLRITPLGRVELLAGKALPILALGLVDGLLMVGVIALWFHVPVRGSLPLLALLTIPFVLAQIGWGLLISLASRTQQQAVLFVFALAMLEVACSGFIVPASDMPGVMRVVSNGSSVQHYLVILRGILLRGAGLRSLWQPALALTGIALAALGLAWLRLRMGLDADSPQKQIQRAWAARRQQWARRAAAGSNRPGRKACRNAARQRLWIGKPMVVVLEAEPYNPEKRPDEYPK